MALAAGYFAVARDRFIQAQRDYDDLTIPLSAFVLFSNSNTSIDAYIPLNYVLFQRRQSALSASAAQFDLAGGVLVAVWLANLVDASLRALEFEKAEYDSGPGTVSKSGFGFTIAWREAGEFGVVFAERF